MAEMLLINPRRRRRATKARRRNPATPSPAQRRARAAFAAASRARSRAARSTNPVGRRRRRARNPVAALARRRVARRSNPVAALSRRRARRRNPIGIGSVSSYLTMIKAGLIGGAGAVAVDVAYGYISPYLPASLQRTPGQVGVGDAVKAGITVALGKLLSKATRGLSEKAALGALTVQAHGMIASMLPSTVTLGYGVPSQVSNMQTRIGPNRRALSRYTAPGATQMLNGVGRYTQPFATQMLASRGQTMAREMGAVR